MRLVEGLVTEDEKATGIGTSGRGGVTRLMMGSVSDKIVRSAPCPVLTVHPHDREEPTPSGPSRLGAQRQRSPETFTSDAVNVGDAVR